MAGFFVTSRIGGAFVELHLDVATERVLDLHRALWGKEMLGAIEMRPEGDSLLLDAAQLAEAENLESPAVGEDGAIPGHKFVQPAQVADQLVARPQIQVIG